jgi:hypothetical protein
MWFAQQQEASTPRFVRWLDTALSLLYGRDVFYPEFCLSITAIVWGLWLLNPYWAAFSSTPTFAIMQQIAPEDVWGILVLLLGCFLLYGIARLARPAMRWSTLGLCLFWLIVTVSIGFSNFKGTGWVAYAGYTWLNALAYLRLSSAKL